jgi:hypothetical protein
MISVGTLPDLADASANHGLKSDIEAATLGDGAWKFHGVASSAKPFVSLGRMAANAAAKRPPMQYPIKMGFFPVSSQM